MVASLAVLRKEVALVRVLKYEIKQREKMIERIEAMRGDRRLLERQATQLHYDNFRARFTLEYKTAKITGLRTALRIKEGYINRNKKTLIVTVIVFGAVATYLS